MNSNAPSLPGDFALAVLQNIELLLRAQQPDGGLTTGTRGISSQMAIMPLAFCYAGVFGALGEPYGFTGSPRLRQAIVRLGESIVQHFDDDGKYLKDSAGLEQRLIYAWIEALRVLRERSADDQALAAPWAQRIEVASDRLARLHLEKLRGIRRFVRRYVGTGLNHVMLYVTTCYRVGQVLGRDDLMQLALPIGRAIASDIHPDGYYEEHGDLLQRGGPSPIYNYVTQQGCALLHEWTGESVFAEALQKSTRFHGNFCYPDGQALDLIDERVRFDHVVLPSLWGLHGFSLIPEGRGIALNHFANWKRLSTGPTFEQMARISENFLYWHEGPPILPAFERPDHTAQLSLPAAIMRRGNWCIAVSAIPAISPEDPEYRQNSFTLDRQKLFSVWNQHTGIVIDGSSSKYQPAHSTYHALAGRGPDYYPIAGTVQTTGDTLIAHAIYKTFRGDLRVGALPDGRLQIDMTIAPDGNRGPFVAGFTLRRALDRITAHSGQAFNLDENETFTCDALGGGIDFGNVRIEGPPDMRLSWPLSAHNPYTPDHTCAPKKWQPHITVQLTPERPTATFIIAIL